MTGWLGGVGDVQSKVTKATCPISGVTRGEAQSRAGLKSEGVGRTYQPSTDFSCPEEELILFRNLRPLVRPAWR